VVDDIKGDESGQIVCESKYDSYGNHKVLDSNRVETTSVNFIGNINPFRYKGYYYDVETQLYWVSSRYYSPELCRWISPDSIEYLDAESINGLNLYCYCMNNPIMNVDPSGHAWYNVLWDWINTIAGFLNPTSTLTALGSIAVAAIDGRWNEVVEDWNNGRLNPFNQDASIAKEAKVLSFYKGSTVVRQDIIGTCSAFGTIWLKNGDETTIKHEYGHSIQERLLGPLYWTTIAIPSVTFNKFGSNKDIDYYSTPWERTADLFGGVSRESGYKKGSIGWAIVENLLGPIVIPFYFWLGY